jgi:hypothetical protein
MDKNTRWILRSANGELTSIIAGSPFSDPVILRSSERRGVFIGIWKVGDETAEIPTAGTPFDMEAPDYAIFGPHGRWIGPDKPAPYRVITNGALFELGPVACAELFRRYDAGDYGEECGEVGFAVYEVGRGEAGNQRVYLIDDAVRTPEGEPPARDPKTSPGPQTLLLPEEY